MDRKSGNGRWMTRQGLEGGVGGDDEGEESST